MAGLLVQESNVLVEVIVKTALVGLYDTSDDVCDVEPMNESETTSLL